MLLGTTHVVYGNFSLNRLHAYSSLVTGLSVVQTTTHYVFGVPVLERCGVRTLVGYYVCMSVRVIVSFKYFFCSI